MNLLILLLLDDVVRFHIGVIPSLLRLPLAELHGEVAVCLLTAQITETFHPTQVGESEEFVCVSVYHIQLSSIRVMYEKRSGSKLNQEIFSIKVFNDNDQYIFISV